MSTLLDAVVGWTLFAALVAAIGAILGHGWIAVRAAPTDSAERCAVRVAAARGATAAGVALPIAFLLYFVRQLVEFRDPFAPLSEDVSMLIGTPWGELWLVATAAAVAAAIALVRATPERTGAWFAAAATVTALASFPALTGHAAGESEWRTLAIAADTVHVLAAGGWMGGLAVVLYAEFLWTRSAHDGEPGSLLPRTVPVFSPLAILCVALLVITGTFASWLHLTTLSELVATTYGRTLSLKLALVAVVLALGALNWRRLTPRLGTSDGDAALRRAAAIELLVAQLVLFVTAVLVRTDPSQM